MEGVRERERKKKKEKWLKFAFRTFDSFKILIMKIFRIIISHFFQKTFGRIFIQKKHFSLIFNLLFLFLSFEGFKKF